MKKLLIASFILTISVPSFAQMSAPATGTLGTPTSPSVNTTTTHRSSTTKGMGANKRVKTSIERQQRMETRPDTATDSVPGGNATRINKRSYNMDEEVRD